MGIIWHHMMVASDEWPHVFGKPSDCWCEPEVDELNQRWEIMRHNVVRHQDMTGKPVKAVSYG